MKQKKARLAVAAALLIAVLVVVAVWLWHPAAGDGRKEADAPAPPASVQVAPDTLAYPASAAQLAMLGTQDAVATPVPIADALSARVAYDEDVTARVFPPVAGRIVALRAQAGDQVRAGQPLAEIDAPDFGTARSDLDKARADEEHKRLAYERANALGPGEGIAAKDLEAARADYDAARAETQRARERLGNLNPRGMPVQGQRITLASPLAGVVTERSATPALEVNPTMSNPLFVVTDPKRLWLMIDIPEGLQRSIRIGSSVGVESDAWPNERFHARIVQLGQVVDPNTRRVVARARLDNPTGALLPEMFVRASILEDAGDGIRVPNTALVTRGVQSFVFVEVAPGRFQRRRVQLAVRGADTSYVTAGLRQGEKVVTTGALLLDAELGAGQGSRP